MNLYRQEEYDQTIQLYAVFESYFYQFKWKTSVGEDDRESCE